MPPLDLSGINTTLYPCSLYFLAVSYMELCSPALNIYFLSFLVICAFKTALLLSLAHPVKIKVDFGCDSEFEVYRLDKEKDGDLEGVTKNLEFTMPCQSCILIKEI